MALSPTAYGHAECADSVSAALGHRLLPVLLVHGRGKSADSMSTIARRLRASGYPELFVRAIDLEPSDGPNALAARDQIAPLVESWLRDIEECIAALAGQLVAPRKIDIVAHSMGGVSTRWYASQLRPDRVNVWLSLASPNHGSSPECPGAADSGKRDLCPPFASTPAESEVQFTLNGSRGPDSDETPFGVGRDSAGVRSVAPDERRRIKYITLRIRNDAWIKPAASAIVDGAGGVSLSGALAARFSEGPPGNFLARYPLDHDELLDDPFVHEFILSVLESARAADAQDAH